MEHRTEDIEQLYKALISAWNKQDAKAFANLAADRCIMIGFDGTQMFGKVEIEASIGQIFAHHQTATYVTVIKGVNFLTNDVAVLNSVVGMVQPGATDINPDLNAIQLLTAKRY